MANKTWDLEEGLRTATKDYNNYKLYSNSITALVKLEPGKDE